MTTTQLREMYRIINERVRQWQISNLKTIDAFTRYKIEQEELRKT